MELRPYTVIVMVGPSHCGKSTYASRASEYLRGLGYRSQVVSSDDCRRELLGVDLHKYDPVMLQASAAAFSLLRSKVDLLTRYPINNHFVWVDTTGLDSTFRQEMVDIARANQYHVQLVVFDYKKREDYFTYEGGSKPVISKQIKKLRERVLPDLNRKLYDGVTTIRRPGTDIEVTVDERQLRECQLEAGSYLVVGDVHGCLTQLIEVMTKAGYTFTPDTEYNPRVVEISPRVRKTILVGDWCDYKMYPGFDEYQVRNANKDIITFLYQNQEHFLLVKGNHENYVYNTLVEPGWGRDTPLDVVATYFTTVATLASEPHLVEQFKELVESSYSHYEHPEFIVTHSPCSRKYLGKVDQYSRRMMLNWRYPHRQEGESQRAWSDRVWESLSFDTKEYNFPLHICGHVAVDHATYHNNTLLLDTGCLEGHRLTGVIVGEGKPRFLNSASTLPRREIVLHPNRTVAAVNLEGLEPEDRRRIDRMVANQVGFVSGTMSPADRLDSQLESLEEALRYYQRMGVERISVQGKGMGSRINCEVIPSGVRLFSRNGHLVVERPDYAMGSQKAARPYMDYFLGEGMCTLPGYQEGLTLEYLLIDGELLPWSILGQGLIDGTFRQYVESLEAECQFLSESGFQEEMERVKTSEVYQSFIHDKRTKGERIEAYGQHVFRTYEALSRSGDLITPDLDTFRSQMELYGSNTTPHLDAFSILKVRWSDSSEWVCSDNTLTNSEMLDILTPANINSQQVYESYNVQDVEGVRSFYNQCVAQGMEGIVIKPEVVHTEGVLPYLKVRNPQYLHLVYGPDYQDTLKYQRLLDTKRVGMKRRLSLREWELGLALLRVDNTERVVDNQEYINLVAALTLEIKEEAKLDPRL